MDNETTKKSVMDVEWIPIYQKRLGDVVAYAKGKMSMAEFAKKCGMNPITFSRIIKGDIKKPLSQEEIKTIAENSDQDTEETFEYLMRANGMVTKSDYNVRRQEREQRRAQDKQRRETIQNSLIRSLFEGGHTIVPIINTPKEELNPVKQKSRYRLSVNCSYVLSVQGDESAYWNYRINTFTGDEFKDDSKAYDGEVRGEVVSEGYFCQEVFLRDVWEPEAFEKTRYSFVFANKDVFEGFFKYLEGVKVNNSFSLILVDIKEQRVVEERFIPRHDGKEQKSLFIIKKDSRE